MPALADFRTRALRVLADPTPAIWTTDDIDEALRHALEEYSQARPLEYSTAFELPSDGREIALDDLTGLITIQDVYWPYDDTTEVWPPNRVRGFHIYWDDTRPVLYLDQWDGAQPQAGEELRLWYSTYHTIQDLDSASATTIPTQNESLIVTGAAGHAAMSRALDLVEVSGADLYAAGLLGSWGSRKLRDFRERLLKLATANARAGAPFTSGWKLDKWDEA